MAMALLIAVVILALAFYLLAVVTEEFFVPSIDIIAKKLGLSNDAAGATLLAMGSSTPEFFIVLIAVLGLSGSGHADIGAGSVVGSAIFNVLVIVGVSAMFKTIKLDWKNAIRDVVFYLITIMLLFFAFADSRIVMLEAVIFVLSFFIYIYLVLNWKKWFDQPEFDVVDHLPGPAKSLVHRLAHRVMSLAIPDPKEKMKHYVITHVGSLVAIAGLSWILVEQIVSISSFLSINPTFVALTVLAAGTSIPDAIGSVIVARQGRGDMAFSNALGSNIFDILFGLGLPWMIALLISPGAVKVTTGDLNLSVVLLFGTVCALLFFLLLENWKIGKLTGATLVGGYLAYCTYIALVVV